MFTRNCALLLLLLLIVPLARDALATTFNVTTSAQLITAINSANDETANPGADTIVLADGNFDVSTINNFWYGPTGLPPIRSDITIRNNGNGATIRRTGGPNFRLFYIASGNTSVGPSGAGALTLINLSLSGGFARGGDGGANSGGGGGLGAGGAIYNQGTLNMYSVSLNGNAARGGDGGSDDGVSVESAGGGGMGGSGAAGTAGGGVFSRSAGGGGMGGNGGILSGTSTGGSGGGGISQTTLPGDTANNGGSPTSATTGGVGGGTGGAGGNGGLGGAAGNLGGGGGGNGSSSSSPGGSGGIGGGAGGGNTDSQGGFGGGGGNGIGNSRGGFGAASGSGGANPTGDLGFGGGGGGAVGTIGSQPGGFGGGVSTANSFSGGGGAGLGGAIFNDAGTLSAFNVTIAANTAQGGNGGAAFGSGGAGGGAGFGGGIFNRSGSLTLTQVTIASNTVVGGTGTVGSTTTDNGSASGGALYHLGINLGAISRTSTSASSTASLTIANSVLANSNTGNDVVLHNFTTSVGNATVNLTRVGANIVESSSSIGTIASSGAAFTSGDPQLGATLALNGAPTGGPQSLFPTSGTSPVLNAGSNAAAALPAFAVSAGVALSDQRGSSFSRITGPLGSPNVDLGAVEVQFRPLVQIGAPSLTSICTSANPTVTYSVTYIGALTVTHSTATVPTGGATATVNSTGIGANRQVNFSGISVPTAGTLAFQVPPGAATNNASVTPDAVVTGSTANSNVVATSASFQVNGSPTITPTTLPNGTLGVPYSQSISAAPAGSYSFSLTGGALPTPLALSPLGVVSGTPTQSGPFSFTATAINSATTCAASQVINITISGNNTAPTISDVANQTINEDAATGALAFTVGDAETAVAALTVSGSSSNLSLVPNANIVFGGSGAARTVTVTPVPNLSGSSTITLTVTDGGGLTATDTFLLTVNPLNDLPSFVAGPNQTLPAGTSSAQTVPSWASAISDGDPDFNQSLTFNVSNTNNGLFSVQPSVAANGTLSFTPNGSAGSATVSVSLTDDATAGGAALTSAIQTFTITISANTAPTISDVADPTISEDAATGALAFTVGDAETAVASLTVSGSSSNVGLVPNANIVFGGSGSSRTVTVTPTPNLSGSSTITLTVTDGGGLTATDTFLLMVNPLNDLPSFVAGSNQSLPAGTSSAQAVPNWATAINDGDPDFTQSLTFNVSNTNNGLFSVQPTVAANGTLTYTPNGSAGSATVSVSLTDDATAGGKALTSAIQTFTITIASGSTDPVIVASAVSRAQGSANFRSVIANVSDAGGAGNVTVTATPATGSGVVISGIQNNNGVISALIRAGCLATNSTFTLTANNGSNSNVTTLPVTVTPSGNPTWCAWWPR